MRLQTDLLFFTRILGHLYVSIPGRIDMIRRGWFVKLREDFVFSDDGRFPGLEDGGHRHLEEQHHEQGKTIREPKCSDDKVELDNKQAIKALIMVSNDTYN